MGRPSGASNQRASMSRNELLSLPVSVDLPTAGRAFGLTKAAAYRAVAADDFPVPVIRAGRRIVVSTAEILKALGIDPHGGTQ